VAHDLTRTYFTLLIPAILGFILIYIAKFYHLIVIGPIKFLHIISPVIFTLSVVFAIALPIFFRTLFAHRTRYQQSVSEVEWIRFECHFLYIAMITPYLALLACLFELTKFHSTGTILMALYAAYYYYPSKKRVDFDRRIFRVR